MSDSRRTINISGGTFARSNIAGGNINQTIVAAPSGVTVAVLLERLQGHREELVRLSGEHGQKVGRRLTALEDELAEPEPDGDVVRHGWRAISKLLAGGAAAAESVTTITEMVKSLFGA